MFKKFLSPFRPRRVLKNKSGFTLIEFLVVVAAVGIVTTLYLAVLKPIFGKSNVTAAVGSINNLKANALVYSSDNMSSFSTITITNMVSQNILGPNWSNETACVPGASLTGTHHCNPWGGQYEIAAGTLNPSQTFTITLTGVPEDNAYQISSELWNSDDNAVADTGAPTGTTTGTEFTPSGGSAIWFSQGNPTTLTSTVGILEIYFGY